MSSIFIHETKNNSELNVYSPRWQLPPNLTYNSSDFTRLIIRLFRRIIRTTTPSLQVDLKIIMIIKTFNDSFIVLYT